MCEICRKFYCKGPSSYHPRAWYRKISVRLYLFPTEPLSKRYRTRAQPGNGITLSYAASLLLQGIYGGETGGIMQRRQWQTMGGHDMRREEKERLSAFGCCCGNRAAALPTGKVVPFPVANPPDDPRQRDGRIDTHSQRHCYTYRCRFRWEGGKKRCTRK